MASTGADGVYRARAATSGASPMVYTRTNRPEPSPGVATSPRRIFGSLRKPKGRRTPTEDSSSPTGSAPSSGSPQCATATTPPKKTGGNIWDNIRPRSKSDSRSKHPQPRVYMHTIPSVDESQGTESPPPDKLSNKHVRPLFVDTQLANSATGADKNRRSPVAQAVMDFVRGRNRTMSASPGVGGLPARGSYGRPSSASGTEGWSSSGGASPLRSPVIGKSSAGPSPVRYRVAMPQQQRSLDSGLELSASPSANIMGKLSDPYMSRESNDLEFSRIILENQDMVYSMFARAHKCYDLIPTSTKLVVFDTQLPVRKAFFALVYNGVRAAPLWDSNRQEFVGMLTITDFIHILFRYYRSGQTGGIKELEEHKISTWRDVLEKDEKLKDFITIDPNENLQKAVQILLEARVHRLPVIDRLTGNISYILTHKRIIKFLYLYINDLPRPEFMDQTIKELGIGTWGHIETVTPETPLIQALAKFLEFKVSALPLVDSEGRVVDIYAKFDVINLAVEKSYNNLEVTVGEALNHRSEWFEGVCSCLETDSLGTVIDKLVKAEVHRLVATDANRRIAGIVSLSDILKFIVLTPPISKLDGIDDEMDVG